MDPLFGLLIWILCVIAIVWLAFWVKAKMGLPADVDRFASFVIGGLALIAVIWRMMAVLGVSGHLLTGCG